MKLMITSLLLYVNIHKMATKKRSWDSKEPACPKKCKEKCDESTCCKESKVETKKPEKILVTKESLEDGRISRNELIMEITELNNTVDTLFEDLIDTAVELDNVKMMRNISIIINI